MLIEDKRNGGVKTFGQVQPGAVIDIGGTIYLKLVNTDRYNAVRLGDGIMATFSNSAVLREVTNARLVIE